MNRLLFLYFLLFLFVTSCEDSKDKEIPEEGEVSVEFILQVPAITTMTRAYTDESIRNIDLLIFDGNNQVKFLERIKIDEIIDDPVFSNRKSFKVRLKKSSGGYIFHILANVRGANDEDLISLDNVEGTRESESIPELCTSELSDGEGVSLPLMMWGMAEVNGITSSTVIQNGNDPVKMLRNVAAVRIQATTGLSEFEMKAFTLMGVSDRGWIAADNFKSPATGQQGDVNIRGSVNRINYGTGVNSGVWGSAIGNITEDLYVYETITENEAAFIILKASYAGVEGFYKIAFWGKLDSDAPEDEERFVNLIRNYRYRVLINDVWGYGYTSFDEAVNAPASSNIKMTIINDDDDIITMVADGHSILGISYPNNEPIYFPYEQGVYYFNILSFNYLTSQGVMPQIEQSTTGGQYSFVSDIQIEAIDPSIGRYEVELKLYNRSDPEKRRDTLTVRAGNLVIDNIILIQNDPPLPD